MYIQPRMPGVTLRGKLGKDKPRRRPYTPRMAPEARREQLLDAALCIITRDGYGAVSIEGIAREADVSRPVVYNVFDDLNALLFALLDRQEQRALNQLLATISLEPDWDHFDAYLKRTIREMAAVVAGDPLTWRPIFLAYEGTPAVVRARIDAAREVVRGRIEVVTEAATIGGASEIDAGVVSHSLVAIGEYFGRRILEAPETIDIDRIADTVSALLTAVGPRSASKDG
jgi:AcrR family transcriptional regulator